MALIYHESMAQPVITNLFAPNDVEFDEGLLFSIAINGGSSAVDGLEYFFDADPGIGGGFPVNFTSNLPNLGITVNADISSLLPGSHILGVRALNSEGVFSVPVTTDFNLLPPTTTPNITAIEFFIGQDPGYGLGTQVINADPDVFFSWTALALAQGTSPGVYDVGYRARDENGFYSATFTSTIVIEADPAPRPNLVSYEYFFDVDPGYGNGTQVDITADSDFDGDLIIPLSEFDPGYGIFEFYIRFKDADGQYGTTYNHTFTHDQEFGPADVDFNGDMAVNTGDLMALLSGFGCTGSACVGDVNDDGAVNTLDLTILLQFFGLSY